MLCHRTRKKTYPHSCFSLSAHIISAADDVLPKDQPRQYPIVAAITGKAKTCLPGWILAAANTTPSAQRTARLTKLAVGFSKLGLDRRINNIFHLYRL
ncbi:MAG: hypothetical protein ACJASV_001950 [Pseudorhodobacter sp.]|jgi:hypothetical protein